MELGFLVQIAIEGSVVMSNGQARKVVNSFVYGLADRDLSFTTKQHLGANFLTNVWAGIATQLSVAFQGLHTWVIYPNTAADVPLDAGLPNSGANGGERLPMHQCVFAGLKTAFRTRPYIGAKRFGPVAEADVVGDELTAAALAAWNGALAAISVAMVQFEGHEAIVLKPVVWSRVLSDIDANIPPGVGAVITAATANRTLGQWRHRRERTQLSRSQE